MAGGSRDALDVLLKGSVANVETAFHVTMGVYHHPTENRHFYAPDREPTVDLPFQLWHITGLDNYSIPRRALVRRNSSVKPPATTGSCPSQSFCGSDMRAAYYEGTALTGAGQNIGLLEFSGFDIADVNAYYKNAGQKRTAKVIGISTDGSPITCFASKTAMIPNRPLTSPRRSAWRQVSPQSTYTSVTAATRPCWQPCLRISRCL